MGTVRQEIISILTSGYFTAKELSKTLSLSEKEIIEHLKEINKSHFRIEIRNSQCKKCGFKFTNLKHFKKLSKCPSCKSTFISEPEFTVRK
ncbi:transcriptional regulator [Deferribacter abyssi]|uniref:transcriptional regulator n=1 Tax=Deferribacter abyssi TaxID=213806 RepID=UPI003C1B00BF